MTDSTDNARGPERIWWNAAPMPHSHTSTVQFAGGAEYIRADLAPDPQDARVKGLVDIVARLIEEHADDAEFQAEFAQENRSYDEADQARSSAEMWRKARAALAAFDKGGKDE